MLVVLLCTVDV